LSLQLRTFASNLQGDDLLQLDSPLDSGPEDQAGFHARLPNTHSESCEGQADA
jgi:hypothetical protein